MEQLNYHEIVEKLAEIDQRLRQMDLNQHDRIRIHLRNLTELAEATDRGALAQITNNLTGGSVGKYSGHLSNRSNLWTQ